MTDDFAVRAVALHFIGETYEMGYPFRIFFADDLMKRIAARLPNGILLLGNDHGSRRIQNRSLRPLQQKTKA